MEHIVVDTLIDSATMLPLLFVIYCLIAWLEQKFGDGMNAVLPQSTTTAGPALGAILGCLPQCGFSVLASVLYVRRLITTGTLLAVYLATSDETIPIILSQPDKAVFIFPLLIIKFFVALTSGYAIDAFTKSPSKEMAIRNNKTNDDLHTGCCKHHISATVHGWKFLWHPLVHTIKIFIFILIVTLAINYLILIVGNNNIDKIMLRDSLLQPLIAAMIGLIPSCAASVAITKLFLLGNISYGSMIAGLCCSAGLGTLILLKEKHPMRDVIRVLLLLVGISTVVGTLIQVTYG